MQLFRRLAAESYEGYWEKEFFTGRFVSALHPQTWQIREMMREQRRKEGIMKKLLVLLLAGVILTGLSGCGNTDGGSGEGSSQIQETSEPENTVAPEPDDTATPGPESPEDSGVPTVGGSVTDHNYEEGWTEDMEAVKKAVTDYLGEDYWPNTAMPPEVLESLVGISPDMYEDYFAEMPMISTNVDTLIVIKAWEDQADAVEDALLAYHDRNVSNTMQYPQNVGKIQAARVERIGNYVIFAQLGADTSAISEEGDQEVIIAHCQEVNDLIIEMISNVIQH